MKCEMILRIRGLEDIYRNVQQKKEIRKDQSPQMAIARSRINEALLKLFKTNG